MPPTARALPARLIALLLAGLLLAALLPLATLAAGVSPAAALAQPSEQDTGSDPGGNDPGGDTAADVAASLPQVETGARPGPDVLYAPAPEAPQLQNHDPRFSAEPLLVSGTEAYVDGEYLYQGFVYDDYGADTDGLGADQTSPRHGNLDYPTDSERYAGNAADLVEFRVAPRADEVVYRLTLNTLLEEDSTIAAIAFDTGDPASGEPGTGEPESGTDTLPRDPGAAFPGTDEVITTWGTGAEHTSFTADGAERASTPVEVDTDLEAAQITITVPRSVSDPAGTWQATVATGLYDRDTGGWLRPARTADADTPGGAGPLNPRPSGIFNLAFRFDEPVTEENTPPDTAQAAALREDDPTRFGHGIDFDALAAGENSSTVPDDGTMVRIFPSRLDLGAGQHLDEGLVATDQESSSFPEYRGRLQPYSVHVPSGAAPHGFTLNLHSLSQRHWQYNGSIGTGQLGEDRGHIVATPMARGVAGWYQDEAAVDTFEVWNDIARHYELDSERTAVAGYSMGGYGAYRFAARFPDLFGAAFTTVAPPGEGVWQPPAPPSGGADTLSNRWLASARNVPFLNVVAGGDQLVPITGPRAQNLGAPELGINGFEQLGYRHRFVIYPSAEHFTLAALDYDVPMATEFLGDAAVNRDPRRVTFTAAPEADNPELGLIARSAYWVSGIETGGDTGTIDATSDGFGLAEPETERGTGGGSGPLPFTEIHRTWDEPEQVTPDNRLKVHLDGIAAATIHLERARLEPSETLTVPVESDQDARLHLDGVFAEGTTVERDGEPVGQAGPDGASLPVHTGKSVFTISPG